MGQKPITEPNVPHTVGSQDQEKRHDTSLRNAQTGGELERRQDPRHKAQGSGRSGWDAPAVTAGACACSLPRGTCAPPLSSEAAVPGEAAQAFPPPREPWASLCSSGRVVGGPPRAPTLSHGRCIQPLVAGGAQRGFAEWLNQPVAEGSGKLWARARGSLATVHSGCQKGTLKGQRHPRRGEPSAPGPTGKDVHCPPPTRNRPPALTTRSACFSRGLGFRATPPTSSFSIK